MIQARDYQEFAVESIFKYFEKKAGNPVVAMPGGTGKSVVIARFIQTALERYPGTRVMKLTHVKELIEQNLDKLLKMWPTAPAGVYSSGLKRKDLGYPIIFGGVATVAKAVLESFGRIDLLLIDEGHLVSPNDGTMYRFIVNELTRINPHLKAVGFTATAYRLGQGMLTDPGGLFTDLCVDMTSMKAFNWFIDEGYLSPLIPKPTSMGLDVSGVGTSGGEYKQNQLQEAIDKDEITYGAVQEMLTHGQDRNHWMVFASGIEHVIHVASMLDSLGIPATYVHSKMKSGERDANILAFESGEYRAIVNNGILTTGYDYPAIDMIGVLRPTKSTALWVQMLSRGTRPVYAPGFDLNITEGRLAAIANGPKQDCLVLDFAHNTAQLGPINDPVLPRRKGKGGGGIAPIRICDSCGTYIHASLTVCPHCGFEFPRFLKINEYAGTEALIVKDKPIVKIFKVDRVVYNEQRREDKPTYLRASYFCGLRLFKESICLEHDGYARKKARDWWRIRSNEEAPDTVLEAVTKLDTLRTPTHIRVWLKPKFDEILAHDYTGTAFGGVEE